MPEGWEEIRALLALSRVEGLGHERLRRSLAHFGMAIPSMIIQEVKV